jgi:hypothetical protein
VQGAQENNIMKPNQTETDEENYYRHQQILAIDKYHMITTHVEDGTKVTSAYDRDRLGLGWTRVWTIGE